MSKDLQLTLLKDTLRFVLERIPYYRERSEDYSVSIKDIQDLAKLPFVEPDDFVNLPQNFASSMQWPSAVCYSSSTTGKMGRARWHIEEEYQAFYEFCRSMGWTKGGDKLTLSIHPFDQGPALSYPEDMRVVSVPLIVPWHYEKIHQILRDGWQAPNGFHQIYHLCGFSPGLRILTEWFIQRGIDPSGFGVKLLEGYGSIQPAVWRRKLEKIWDAPYIDRYGLSEVKHSSGIECTECGAYHFPPLVIAEVVDLKTREPIQEGIGVMVFTELYPFAQLQVLLRYWTGDIVEIVPSCTLSSFGVRFLGRLAHSVVLDIPRTNPLVAGSLQVGEICAELPDIALNPISWADWAQDVGAPRFHLSSKDSTLLIRVELRYSPDLFPERVQEMKDRLSSSLIEKMTGLRAAVASKEVDLQIEALGPGELGESIKV